MKRILACMLIVAAMAAGAIAVSCGGGDEDEKEPAAAATEEVDERQETPVAEETEEEEAKPTEEKEDEESGDSLEGVPIYPGAKKITSGEWSGSEMPVPMIGSPKSPEDYASVKFGMYEIEDPAGEVFDWYKDEMKDWKEEWTFSGDAAEGAAGMGVWTKDGGKMAAWILVGEEEGATSLIVLAGSQ